MPMIHNRGRSIAGKISARTIIYPVGWDENGKALMDGKKVKSEVLKPGQHKMLTNEQYEFLKKQFPTELVNIDDMRDMQAQFKPAEEAKPREGYLSPEEVEKRVQARVAEEMNKKLKEWTPPTDATAEAPALDDMDRADMIALIEKEGLGIEYKNYKSPVALRGAIKTAIENKKAAAAEDAA